MLQKSTFSNLVLDRPEIKTEAHTVVHTTRVLNNNVRECMSSTIIGNVDAKDRRRHNEPEFITRKILLSCLSIKFFQS